MSLEKNLDLVRENISIALSKSDSKEVTLVAATKMQPFEKIVECYKSGVTSIGENRVQEALGKFESFENMPKLKKRFIGHLQKNKVNKCLELFDTIDSVDSNLLLNKINSRCVLLKKKIEVLLEINISEEPQKKGYKAIVDDEILKSFGYKNVIIKGLMTVGSYSQDEKKNRNQFSKMRNLKEKISHQIPQQNFNQLSMGMSGDYTLAIEEGSTIIRLGTVLFGKRG